MHFSFRLLEHHYRGMYQFCTGIEEDQTRIAAAFASCWGFIDVLHRLRELAQVIPGLGHKAQELKRFLGRTKLAEPYRHYIQHLRRELVKSEPNPFPVWGSLTWVDSQDPNLTHTVMLGANLGNTGYSGAVFDTVERRWVSRVCLGVGTDSFNFDPIFEEAMIFEKFVVPWMLAHDADTLTVLREPPIISIRFDGNVQGHDESDDPGVETAG